MHDPEFKDDSRRLDLFVRSTWQVHFQTFSGGDIR